MMSSRTCCGLPFCGKLDAILGGPPCGTFSLRAVDDQGPRRVRGSYGALRYGLEDI